MCAPAPEPGPAVCVDCDPGSGRAPACAAGERAAPSTGCVAVGAPSVAWRAADGVARLGECARYERTDLEAGCVAVGPRMCAAEWRLEGGCWVEPAACPGGVALPSGCLWPADPAGCPEGRWGVVPEGWEGNAPASYVDSAAADGGDGSAQRPHRRIADALATFGGGPGVVYLAPGDYAGLRLPDGVSLVGHCAADTRLVADGGYALNQQEGAVGALVGLTLVGGAQATVRTPATLTLHGVLVRGAAQGVVLSGSRGAVRLVESVIDGEGGALVDGIVAGPGQVALERSGITGTQDGALLAVGTTIEVTGSFVGGVVGRPRVGDAIQIADGAHLTVADSVLAGYRGAAVHVLAAGEGRAPSVAALDRVVVRQTRPGPSVAGESGLRVGAGSRLTVRDSALVANPLSQVIASGEDAEAAIERSLLRGAVASVAATGVGALADRGGRIVVTDCEAVANPGSGLAAFNGGTLAVERSVIRGNGSEALGFNEAPGAGVAFGQGGRGRVAGSVFLDNVRRGVLIIDGPSDEAIAVEDCTFLQPAGDGYRLAVDVLRGRLHLGGTLLEGSLGLGVGAQDAELALENCAVRGFECVALPGGTVGAGIISLDSEVILRGVDIGPGCGGGVESKFTAASGGERGLTIQDSVVRSVTPPGPAVPGLGGVYVWGSGDLSLSDVVVQDVVGPGGVGLAEGARLEVDAVRIVGVRGDGVVGGGHGVWASDAAAATIRRADLAALHVAGIAWFDGGGLTVVDSRIAEVTGGPFFNDEDVFTTGAGHGVFVAGGTAAVGRSVVEGAEQVAVMTDGGDVRVECTSLSAARSCALAIAGGRIAWDHPEEGECPQAEAADVPRAPRPGEPVLPPRE
ncbi:MAG: hypothetical protein H6702_23135 [Myxococcales bacterium]|nr:hypothetical protein [Myxococcales bacterium]